MKRRPPIELARLGSVLEEYRSSPEFVGLELTDVHQLGNTGDSVLHSAVVRGVLSHVELFLSAGANVNAIGDIGKTPLHYAASRDLEGIAAVLLEHGANPTVKDELGHTPLDIAEMMKCKSVAKILRKKDLRKKWKSG